MNYEEFDTLQDRNLIIRKRIIDELKQGPKFVHELLDSDRENDVFWKMIQTLIKEKVIRTVEFIEGSMVGLTREYREETKNQK